MTPSEANSRPIPFRRKYGHASERENSALEPASLPAPSHNLPSSLTPFIGRQEQVQEVCSLLIDENVRLLSLTGPGGVGKTRLAVRVAEEVLSNYDDGVCFVALASVADPRLVVPTIAQTLGVKAEPGIPISERLNRHLRDLGLLLILDNFEQVVGAAPGMAAILADAPGVQVIVTTRQPLRLYGEYEYPVPPMTLPGDEGDNPTGAEALGRYDAIQLFVARSRATRHDFHLTDANVEVVANICKRLDGLPLALELAAARTRIFSPQALLARLGTSLPVLVGGPVDAPTRHSTLRNAISWSYDLLDAREQKIFALMAVFVGGCTLDAVQGVCASLGLETGDLESQLESLVAQNLLRQREQEDGEPRFGMLVTIREYALERLSEEEDLKDAQGVHARYYLKLAEAGREAEQTGQQHGEWLAHLEREYDNMRAALRRSLDQGDGETALRLAVALSWFWTARGYLVEGSRWLEEALAMSGGLSAALRADAFYLAGWLATSQNDFARTKTLTEESLKLFETLADKRGIAKALSHLGVVAAEQEDYSLALSRFEQSLAVWRELDHAINVAMLVGNLCFLALYEGDYKRAISYGEESLGIQRSLGNRLGIVGTGINLGLALLHAGNYAGGMALHTEMLAEAEALGSKKDMALAHTYLGLALLLQGDHEGASPHCKESLTLSVELGNRFGVARSLVGLAGVAAGEGEEPALNGVKGRRTEMRLAGILSGAAQALIKATRGKLVPAERWLDDRTLKQARKQLGEIVFAYAWEQGEAMSQDQSIAIALGQEPLPAPGRPERTAKLPPDPTPASTGEITSRELEVLGLIAAGLTNREIGERLVLSHRTVEAHLYSIFNKLNVTTRSAATRYAMEHGLAQAGTGKGKT